MRKARETARPFADKNEVLAALLRGQFTGLLLKKRVSVASANEALLAAGEFLKLEGEALRSAEQVKPLVDFLSREKERGEHRANKAQRRVGDDVIYGVQRHKNKRRAFVVVPLGTLDEDGKLKDVRIRFEDGRIVITRRETLLP